MVIVIGVIVILATVIGGWVGIADGNIGNLMHPGEYVIILGAASGSMIIMAPKTVLFEIAKGTVEAIKGIPYSKNSYEELFQALYELFMIGRKNGMIALEDHVNEPASSSIFSKYSSLLNNKTAMTFLCEALSPIIDGRIKAEELKPLLKVQLDTMDEQGHEPINIVFKVGDALPGFGIVAAVLGIVNTMEAIGGDTAEVGKKVGTALVGTFLGIFMAYGFVTPLAVNMGFIHQSKMDFLKCISSAVVSFTTGSAPAMAIETARRGVNSNLRPEAEELEKLMKSIKPA
ncbi:flagellar motor stator protein MotA [Verrucomicrobia bacterium]|nr:flagellar motor stator protein MotA [Verrucomicrobiota bacterium]MDB4642566.1 flagellar motor stator protein MotA [Verrucomicrobiota bacterium]